MDSQGLLKKFNKARSKNRHRLQIRQELLFEVSQLLVLVFPTMLRLQEKLLSH